MFTPLRMSDKQTTGKKRQREEVPFFMLSGKELEQRIVELFEIQKVVLKEMLDKSNALELKAFEDIVELGARRYPEILKKSDLVKNKFIHPSFDCVLTHLIKSVRIQ